VLLPKLNAELKMAGTPPAHVDFLAAALPFGPLQTPEERRINPPQLALFLPLLIIGVSLVEQLFHSPMICISSFHSPLQRK